MIPLEQKQPNVAAIFISPQVLGKITLVYGNELFILQPLHVEVKQDTEYKLDDSKEIDVEIQGALKMFKQTSNACYLLVTEDQ